MADLLVAAPLRSEHLGNTKIAHRFSAGYAVGKSWGRPGSSPSLSDELFDEREPPMMSRLHNNHVAAAALSSPFADFFDDALSRCYRMTDCLARLQEWYYSNCNGDWEHSYGVAINTLDNPGWSIRIDLAGTCYSGRQLAKVENGISAAKRTWTVYWIENDQFHAAGGPMTLSLLIDCFFDWIDSHERSRRHS